MPHSKFPRTRPAFLVTKNVPNSQSLQATLQKSFALRFVPKSSITPASFPISNR